MTESYSKLLTEFETRVRHLVLFCDKLKSENEQLKHSLLEHQETILQQKETIQQLTDRYNRLKLGQYLSTEEKDIQEAKQRVNKLVREIDKCIALLNE